MDDQYPERERSDGGVSLAEWAPRDERRHATLTQVGSDGVKRKLSLVYRPNRVTGERLRLDYGDPDVRQRIGMSDEDAEALDDNDVLVWDSAVFFCDLIAEWSLAGPLVDRAGRQVVPAGQTIPLEPAVVRYVPAVVRNAIVSHVTELTNPNRSASRGSRTR